jgi:hypothetical protein
MSFGTLTDAAPAFRPWHYFVLAALLSATAGLILARGTSPGNLVLVSLAILAAALIGLAVHRTLLPLAADESAETAEPVGGRTRAALEREKTLLLRSIKELEFDRAMGKVSDADFQEMAGRLRLRAIALMKQLDGDAAGYRELIERELRGRLAARSASVRAEIDVQAPVGAAGVERLEPAPAGIDVFACAACGTRNDPDARFCKQCGGRL